MSIRIIEEFLFKGDYANAARSLFNHQQNSWELLKKSINSLKNSGLKEFQFSGYKINAQYNPGRLASSHAKVDPESVKERKCFLCKENLYEEQKGFIMEGMYQLSCNPFPIYPEHFTLHSTEHIPQIIFSGNGINHFSNMLKISKKLSEYYSVFYNGPKSGASAPDHFHFQVCTKNYMPIEDEFHQLKNEYGEILIENNDIVISAINDGLRKILSLETDNEEILNDYFKKIYRIYEGFSPVEIEPMMNLFSLYEKGYGWRILIVPRERHRPSHYFEVGEKHILLSPGCADIGGILIVPLEKDFNKLTKEYIVEIFNEICIPQEKFNKLKEEIKNL